MTPLADPLNAPQLGYFGSPRKSSAHDCRVRFHPCHDRTRGKSWESQAITTRLGRNSSGDSFFSTTIPWIQISRCRSGQTQSPSLPDKRLSHPKPERNPLLPSPERSRILPGDAAGRGTTPTLFLSFGLIGRRDWGFFALAFPSPFPFGAIVRRRPGYSVRCWRERFASTAFGTRRRRSGKSWALAM